MTDIKAVIFDLYGTLIYLANETEPYKRLSKDIGLETPKEFSHARKITLTNNFENLANLVKKIKPNLQIDLKLYEQEIEKEQSSATLYSETKKILNYLQEKNLKLGLISNLATPYKKPFFELGLNKYFHEVLFSCDVGLRKPNPDIYHKMIQMLNVNPSETLMIGDKIHTDINSPKSIGINALHLNRENTNSDSISTLEEVLKYL